MGFWGWVITVWVAFGTIVYGFEKATEGTDFEWEDVWYFTKKILIFCLTWLFMPIILMFHLHEDSKWEKAQKAKAIK